MSRCKPIDTPIEPNIGFKEQGENPPVNKGQYQILVEKLIYLSYTRLDIGFTIRL